MPNKAARVCLIAMVLAFAHRVSAGSAAPAKSDWALESLSGFGAGAAFAYGFGVAGSYLDEGSKPLDQSGFVRGALLGYVVGTPVGIWSYAKLRGLERNAWAAGGASVATGMAAWLLLEATYDGNQQLGPTLLILLPNLAGVLGNNVGLMLGPRRFVLSMSFP